ncbi:hypothetical protein Lcho_0970 [Leptothrix cholodnii SP-6]|uniref:Uncharacterized protein n=1 Tax=Leptothrix cholodnii (strain ATCC 51168 / LMG 8142 / SP-6) TaxID=395495 RepID=B1Y2M6_LEPCP|nr:hypothetical protein [Leptothrix cholodnii]ACB33242.1 hypothetical protein Lcho_0970 [Leptothrix cholodnii SP-6]
MSRIEWWPHTTDTRIASYRLRCAQIVEALRDQGHDVGLHRPGGPVPDTLVLSKRYDARTLEQATQYRSRSGTRLILDLCDNHFFFSADPDGTLQQRADRLRNACQRVDQVIVCSRSLAQVVRQEAPKADIAVVADAAEPPDDLSWLARLREPRAEIRLHRLRRWLAQARVDPARRLIWFGNHGSAGVDGGMADLLTVRSSLERAAAEAPLSLTVVSNSETAYRSLLHGWRLPTAYLPWSQSTFSTALRLHSAAIIPIQSNPFTQCKTANRVLTAGLHGLNVIADAIPSYEDFRGCTVLDDWPHGLGDYLHDRSRRESDLSAAQALTRNAYELAQIAADWAKALGLQDARR